MNVLERWLPFMFRRKSAEEKKADTKPTDVQEAPARAELMEPASRTGHWMREMFDDPFFSQPFGGFAGLDRWFGDFSPSRFSPRVDVTDEVDLLKVTAELPGMDKADVELNIENGLLRIRGEKRHEEESKEHGVYRTERYYGYVDRSIPLPEDVDQDKAEAEFVKGVLTVRFPKRSVELPPGRRIAIKG